MGQSGANGGPIWPSIALKPEERVEAGTTQLSSGDAILQSKAGGEPAVKSMGPEGAVQTAVAIVSDARQAAAVKVAEEQGLVRKAQAGDRLAFDELVRRYDREVLRLATNLVHHPEDARDIYQESFLRVYRNLQRFRFECSFYTWLYRIVTNVALDHLRRRTSRREEQAPVRTGVEEGPTDFFERQPELRASANPEKQLLGQELGERIEEAMKHLSPRERIVFEMKHYQGLRLRAIGELLGTSEETAKNSLFRATQKLRASLSAIR